MGVVEFDLRRTVRAPIDDVFARLADIDGYNEWMPQKGSLLRRTQQTSPGPPALGTTFLDETTTGPTPGRIEEFDPPRRIVFHWWDKSRFGRLRLEGWPGYTLEPSAEGTTLVHHHARMHTHGIYRPATPFLRRVAMRERSVTLAALAESFEGG
jgi:uncharacterized protein YndB with AHSA1/START domain